MKSVKDYNVRILKNFILDIGYLWLYPQKFLPLPTFSSSLVFIELFGGNVRETLDKLEERIFMATKSLITLSSV